VKRLSILILSSLSICVGCQSVPAQKPVWEQVKLKELSAAKHSPQSDKARGQPLQFNVYVFSVPRANFRDVKGIWAKLSTKQIRFNGGNLFNENGFLAGFGQAAAWPPVAEKLKNADSKNLKTINLIMLDNSTERILLLQSDSEQNIFFKAQDNQLNGVTLGPGEAMLRITAATIPDKRGVCNLTIEPTFNPSAKPSSPLVDNEEIVFNSVSLTAQMSAGDFLLLGPANYASQGMTLSSIFFSSGDKSSAQLYLIICLGVNN